MLPLYLSFFAVNCKLRRCKLEICSQPVKINESPYLQLERNCSKMRSKEGMFSMFRTHYGADFIGLPVVFILYSEKMVSHLQSHISAGQSHGHRCPRESLSVILHIFWPERSFGLLPIQKSFGPILL